VSAPLLSVRGLHVSFFMDEGVVQAVDGVSFDVWPGQVVGIVGESGCGKSVTMKAVLQIVEEPGRITAGAMYFRRGAESLDEMAFTAALFERPRHPYTAALMKAVPVPDPRVPSGHVALKGEVASPAQPPSRTSSPSLASTTPGPAPDRRSLSTESWSLGPERLDYGERRSGPRRSRAPCGRKP
jgi:ABC-type dipeptide/oligopeptide/nickel transport system ATPase component